MADTHRILVVEDDDNCRELFTGWLQENHEVTTAADGQEALETLDRRHDIVLLDRDMPVMEGDTVAHEIGNRSGDFHVVMVSARPFDSTAFTSPIDGYLHKPIREDDLLAVIEQYRKRCRYREALDRFFALSAKIGVLESHYSPEDLRNNEAYDELQERLKQCRLEVNEAIGPNPDWRFTFRSCGDTADLAEASAGSSLLR